MWRRSVHTYAPAHDRDGGESGPAVRISFPSEGKFKTYRRLFLHDGFDAANAHGTQPRHERGHAKEHP